MDSSKNTSNRHSTMVRTHASASVGGWVGRTTHQPAGGALQSRSRCSCPATGLRVACNAGLGSASPLVPASPYHTPVISAAATCISSWPTPPTSCGGQAWSAPGPVLRRRLHLAMRMHGQLAVQAPTTSYGWGWHETTCSQCPRAECARSPPAPTCRLLRPTRSTRQMHSTLPSSLAHPCTTADSSE